MEDKETFFGEKNYKPIAYIETKKCPCCGRELPVEAFGKSSATKDGLYMYCKECTNEKTRASRAKRKAEKEGVIDVDGRKLNKVYNDPELAKFTPRQLMQELKARGYRWEYMLEPQRKIMYDKI